MASAADVPNKYDLVINGQGYILDRSYDDSPYRTPPAEYSSTATFLERTNVGTGYSDDAQDFFLTETQNDWTGGEGRSFFRVGDQTAVTQYERSYGVEPRSPGSVRLAPDILTATGVHSIQAACGNSTDGLHFCVDATNLYTVDFGGNKSTLGAHGAGSVATFGLATDGIYIYISGATKLRKYNIGTGAFTDYGTNSAVGALCYTGNLLYSCNGSVLASYGTTGTSTTIFTWKDGTGTALPTSGCKIIANGGSVMILLPAMPNGPELWQYNGTATNIAAHLPAGSVAYDMVELNGIVYCSGSIWEMDAQIYATPAALMGSVPTLWAYTGGSIEIIWQEQTIYNTAFAWGNLPQSPLGTFRNSLVFEGQVDGVAALKLYQPSTGAVMTLAKISVSSTGGQTRQISSLATTFMFSGLSSAVDAVVYPTTTVPSFGLIYLARLDFDNSLQKVFRSVKVDWEKYPGDAGTPSVDFTLQVDENVGLLGNTSGLVSGVENILSTSLVGRTCQVWLQLNKGTSTYGPVVRRVYLRAAPLLQSYKQRQYLLDLVGNKRTEPSQYLTLINGESHTKDGDEMRADLVAAIAAGVISITDRFGTFTGIIEPAQTIFREVRADYGRAEYRALVVVREV
jgi:hypothetical protein